MVDLNKLRFRDVLVLLGGFIIIVYTITTFSSKDPKQITTGDSIYESAPPNYFEAAPGTHWRLSYSEDILEAPVFEDEWALVEFLKSLKIKDKYAAQDLARQQRIFIVRRLTSVMVIETGQVYSREFAGLKVRILDGKNEGKAGWVPSFALQR